MNINTFLRRLFHPPILLLPILTLIALAWNSLAVCGEIHEAARDGDLQKAKAFFLPGLCDEIYYAVSQGDSATVKAMLKENPQLVSCKTNDYRGLTPLHYAAKVCNKDMAEWLLVNKADVNAKDKRGYTPLYYASVSRNNDLVELLRQHGGHP
jgi:ankyrin repeat protein